MRQLVLIVILIELIAAGAIYGLENHDTAEASADIQKELSLISRVNTDGSGIYIASEYDPDDFLTVSETGKVTYNKEYWRGKVFGTPGASSIQHVQLMDIVENELGLSFVKYKEGSEPSDDAVYFVDNINNYTSAVNAKFLDGGILWEPQYHYILTSDMYKGLVTTNELFPGHTCCVIAGYQDYLDKHTDEAVRFLAAYIKAVDYINAAKADPSSEAYAKLVEISMEKIHIEDEDKDKIVKEALEGVVYKYSDKAGSPDLDALKADISSLTESLTDLGSIKVTMAKLGFRSYSEFADAFIDNKYLSQALDYGSWTGKEKSAIKVTAIEGDIHQIALHLAESLGFFDDYGLEIEVRSLGNGGEVAQDLLSGQSDLAFMGAPPITSATVNGEKIHVVEKEYTVEKELSLISRVNTDGSGIYIASKYDPDDFVTVSPDGTVTFHPENWRGKVFGTPGASSIQHVQLMGIVENELGLPFVKYNEGSKPSEDAVYFVDNINNYTSAVNAKFLDGGILWEPQYHYILTSDMYKGLITTNVLFPGHTCCVIAGYQGYLDKNADETARFLAAYIKAVDYINAAKEDPEGEDFANLVKVCDEYIKGLSEEVIKEALMGVVYKYSDKAGSPDLDALKGDISSLTESLTDLGSIKVTMEKLGFKSYSEFADAFIDNKYLSQALDYGSWAGKEKSVIKVTAIDGDIHQIALHLAESLGFFDEYGLEVRVTSLGNGGAVAQDLLSGQSDLAFMGAPPITSATVNSEKVHVVEKAPTVKKDLSLVSRVNTDGSGIYLASKYKADDFVTVSPDGTVTFYPENWGGKVFGTPGASSIQHIQLMSLVTDTLNLKFEKYNDDGDKSPDTVYFVDTITNYTYAVNNAKILDGGILWEPQYHYILDKSGIFGPMATTNVLFPGHTCCVIAGYQDYLDKHPDETSRFLAAYIKAVDYINAAKEDPAGEDFANLVRICDKYTEGLTEEVIKDALMGVVFTYSDTLGTAKLDRLKSDISSLTGKLIDLEVIKRKITDLGFKSCDQFANAFIDNSYLDKALRMNAYSGNDVADIDLALIRDDVHQIAVQVAIEMGYFESYGISVNVKYFDNGGLVSQDLLSGQSDLAFMGAPPITSATVNGGKIIVR